MSDLVVSVTHRLSQDEALRRIQVTVAQTKAQYSEKSRTCVTTGTPHVGALRDIRHGGRGRQEMSW